MFAGTGIQPVQMDVSMTRLRKAAAEAAGAVRRRLHAAVPQRVVPHGAARGDPRAHARAVAILAEARRVLRPGGAVVIVVPNDVTMSAGRLVLRKFPIRYPDHLTFMTPGRLRRWLAEGFRTREAFHLPVRRLPFAVNLYHFVVAEKHRAAAHVT